MNIHEYQAKEVLRSFGVNVPRGHLAQSVGEAVAAADELAGSVWVVKAQIHAGGRGKAGGVRLCKSVDEVKAAAQALLGSVLVTKQTGPAGKEVGKLYVEEGLNIAHEFYLSLLVDREAEAVALVVSPAGGMDIEEVAATESEKIRTFPIRNIDAFEAAEIASFLGLQGDAAGQLNVLLRQLYQAFTEKDAAMLELNPLVLTVEGNLVALDAKFVADDNGLYRQPEIVAMRDLSEEDPREIEAAQYGLNYIQLDGNIGCMVNGAGLAMATMDMIQMKGAKPANFLDVGGGVTVPAVTEAFKLLFSDAQVKAVLVNIFGGIVRCDIIAQGLLEAIKTHPMNVPVVMRLVGTNEDAGRKLVKDAGLDVRWAENLDEAASMAVGAI
ncbi:MAG: ADP-forming succinate--CoA ligase subunit beta [Zetaproteobacteria bacterium CG_4_9_14_3_um_filter_49_83]|nr:MAG: succinate--CoA ligase subunit beta [Zetaproteobacteria bacterium CG1_02_49_23]PIQ32302.1 MAG: ADP-forming succinate--CoA ligase subunit beta [Zetaproteobacteria bacterium CG17_big_fil_post_rev_8_21_14_2_50_50_13]PIV30059.1 MAG: ADP-forming succinate--CoA ligase subunit beta [Zetaproteobacteria bacterium CG02_land_8_20_14_3_00_50_9]PIY56988.1 MAG: ADP-forming succinate--CoA ligase subunit beta [Zetaproteobacteria bacterium CG_4_10_14_0_8_um_filter_49_80]PJA34655.1 MAG: ADP-forming succin